MKKISLFVLAICMMVGTVSAQKMYVRLGLGGGIGLKMYDGWGWVNETQTTTTDKGEMKSLGLGSGLNATLAAGYMVSDNIGIELGVNEYIGLNKKTTQTYNDNFTNASIERKYSGMMLQIVPAILITPGLEKLNPYARIGMIIGILPSITYKVDSTVTQQFPEKASSTSRIGAYKEKNSGGVAVGFTAAAGVDLKLGDKLSFFAELVFNGITYAPSKGKVKEWTSNGLDQMALAKTKQKEWTYEKDYDYDVVIPDGSANKRAKRSYDFSNAEINIGLKLNL